MSDDADNVDRRASLTAQRNALLAAKLAAEHIPACISGLVALAKGAKRESVRRQAATDLIRIATQVELGEELDEPTSADGAQTVLDTLDPQSIRTYVHRQLALNVEPTAAQLARLEMLRALAEELEEKQPKPVPTEPTADDLAAARERLRKARGGS